jgi:hypothetical protein
MFKIMEPFPMQFYQQVFLKFMVILFHPIPSPLSSDLTLIKHTIHSDSATGFIAFIDRKLPF